MFFFSGSKLLLPVYYPKDIYIYIYIYLLDNIQGGEEMGHW